MNLRQLQARCRCGSVVELLRQSFELDFIRSLSAAATAFAPNSFALALSPGREVRLGQEVERNRVLLAGDLQHRLGGLHRQREQLLVVRRRPGERSAAETVAEHAESSALIALAITASANLLASSIFLAFSMALIFGPVKYGMPASFGWFFSKSATVFSAGLGVRRPAP